MQMKVLGTALAAAAASTGVEMNVTPYIEGKEVVGSIDLNGFHGTVKIQSSDDDSTYADVLTVTTAAPASFSKEATMTLKKYMRANVTAFTAGACDVNLKTN